MLFCFAIAVLHRRRARKQANNQLYLNLMILLFLLTTISVVLHSAQNLRLIVLDILNVPLQYVTDKIVNDLA